MMTSTLPEKVTGMKSRVINEIIDYLRALTPVNSTSIRHEYRSDGLASFVTGKDNLTPNVSFDWYWSGPKSIKIKVGYATVHFWYGQVISGADIFPDASKIMSSETEVTLNDSAVARTDVVYAKVVTDFGNAVASITFDKTADTSDGTYPADTWSGSEVWYYIPLYNFTTLGNAGDGTKARYVCSLVRHRGDIEIWSPRIGGTALAGTWDKATDSTIEFVAGIGVTKT